VLIILVASLCLVAIIALVVARSLRVIGPAEIGLVNKRFARRSLADGNPVAFQGEAGYQAELLMPGLRFMLWPVYTVTKHPWVQVPAGEIGVVIAQVGEPIAIGAKSAELREEFGNFSDVRTRSSSTAVRRVCSAPCCPRAPCCPSIRRPSWCSPPAACTACRCRANCRPSSVITAASPPEVFGLSPHQLQVTVIAPNGTTDMVGIVTTLEGEPLPAGDIASRLGGFDDVRSMEEAGATDAEVIDALLGRKNELHNNYQDFQEFLAHKVVASACSTTRCCTAPTCSTRSSCASRWCRCSSCARERSR
jgi:hypothetical protein